MAHDGYPRHNDPPPGYDPSTSHLQNPHSYYESDGQKTRSRQVSRERSELRLPQERTGYSQPRRPIAEAVNHAFDDAHVPNISQDIMAQITQNVIEQLKKSGTLGGAQTPTTQAYQQPLQPPTPNHLPPVAHQQQFPPPPSPSMNSNASPPPATRNVYTPPSPQRHAEQYPSGSPNSKASGADDAATSPIRSSDEARPGSHSSDNSESRESRPKPAEREPSSKEETTLEKIWGPLFDEAGGPTIRLKQFLRGLAVHLIEDYEPKHSLVVTPNKMAKFYENMRITKELYPWHIVFDDDQSSISRMYRQLRIQHHLIQEDDHWDERPDVPGLTPCGFERWATLMILAHPEEEFERAKAAVLNMPINNPDDKKERFPKDIPRRLFPKRENLDVRELVIVAMETHAKITVERPAQETPTPKAEQAPQQRPRKGSETHSHQSFTDASVSSEPAPPMSQSGNLERERKPYSKVPNETAIDDTNPTPTPSTARPIERERKPYSVAPGGSRVYDEADCRPAVPNGVQHQAPTNAPPLSGPPPGGPPPSGPPPSGQAPGLHRSSSAASRPINIPPPPPGGPAAHRLSTSEFTPPPHIHPVHLNHRTSVRRPRGHSPSASAGVANEFRRSEGEIRTFQPGSYEPPSHMMNNMSMREGPPLSHYPTDAHEEDLRRYTSREAEVRRGDYHRGGSPSRKYEPERRSTAYSEEDYYRVAPRRNQAVYH